MSVTLKGVMPALLTPFNHQQQLDTQSLRQLVRFNIAQGMDGLYVGGSTGEAFVQSIAERQEVLEIVAEEAKGKITLIAHVGTVSTHESRSTIRSALKSTAITTAGSLILLKGCQWWCTTFRPSAG